MAAMASASQAGVEAVGVRAAVARPPAALVAAALVGATLVLLPILYTVAEAATVDFRDAVELLVSSARRQAPFQYGLARHRGVARRPRL